MRNSLNTPRNVSNESRAHEHAPHATEKTEEILHVHTGPRGFSAFRISDKRPDTNVKRDEMRDPRSTPHNLSNNSRAHVESRKCPRRHRKKGRNPGRPYTAARVSCIRTKLPGTNVKTNGMRDPRKPQNLSNASRAHENAPDATEKAEEFLNVHTRRRGFSALRQSDRKQLKTRRTEGPTESTTKFTKRIQSSRKCARRHRKIRKKS